MAKVAWLHSAWIVTWMTRVELDVATTDVTVKMWLTQELLPINWQRLLKSRRTVNSSSSMCTATSGFLENGRAWWVSRDGTKMSYWGGATGYNNMCACGVTNSCSSGSVRKCNCPPRGGWSKDSGLLKDKSTLPVTQIRLGDLDGSLEQGYHTFEKLKCYGQG